MKTIANRRFLQPIVVILAIVAGMAMFTDLDELLSLTGEGTNLAAAPHMSPVINKGGMKKIVEAHWQGMEVVPLTWELAAKLRIPLNEKGVLVDEVTLTAAESGLRAKDVIKTLNGFKVANLAEFFAATKRLKTQSSASITALRGKDRRSVTVNLIVPDELGFAQLESAPMVLAGAIPPHRYRGPCSDCHEIGSTGELHPDPGTVTLTPPPISKKTGSPHRYRGKCKLCHVVR